MSRASPFDCESARQQDASQLQECSFIVLQSWSVGEVMGGEVMVGLDSEFER